MTTTFDAATAVSRRSDGLYDAYPDPRFAIVAPGSSTPPAVNGGALLATVLRAVLSESPHPYPVATSAHFLRIAQLAPAQVEVTWLKQGGTAATARASLVQNGRVVLETTVTTGVLAADEAAAGLRWTGPPPGFPHISDCVDLGQWRGTTGPDGVAGYAAQVEVLFDPSTIGWRQEEPSGTPEMRGYFRLREERDPDAYLLAMAVDGLPPVVFGLGAMGWAPTVELTWHMRAVPSPGPLAVQTRCRHVSSGWFDEEAEVWDSTGRLVAQSRQLARVGRGPRRATANGADAAVSERR
jgi:Thioesterase-like superfamily